jgi:hypothetical protein
VTDALPLYADAQYAATIRKPQDLIERQAYERVATYAAEAADAVTNVLAPFEEIVAKQKPAGDAKARTEANLAVGQYGFFARRSVNVAELERWFGRVAFVTFMRRVSDRSTEVMAAHSGKIGHFPPPAPQPFGVSDAGAEALCAEWMRHLGAPEATVTRLTSDGGIDIESTNYIAQVKNYAGTVGVAEVRELAGVSHDDGRHALFFTSGAYASGAQEFAQRIGMALFRYNAVEGTISDQNRFAADMIAHGLDGHRRR